MEKFNAWADPFTGVQPFLPLEGASLGVPALFLGLLIALIRVPVAFLLALVLVGAELGLAVVPDAISFVRRPLQRIVHVALARALLFVLGFHSLDMKYVISRKGNRPPNAPITTSAQAGHVLIANHSSYIDLLFLLYAYSPVFTAVPNTWDDNNVPSGVVVPRTFLGALSDVIYEPQITAANAIPLEQLVRQAAANSWGPVVVFPEATTVNGRVLLAPVPAIPASSPSIDHRTVHILSIKYDGAPSSPVYTCGSFLAHFLKLSLKHTLTARAVLDADVPTRDEVDNWPDQLYSLLANAMGARRAKINVREKFPFLQYFAQHRSTYKR